MRKMRKVTAVVEVTFMACDEKENDRERNALDLTAPLTEYLDELFDNERVELVSSVVLSAHEDLLPCAHLTLVRITQVQKEQGASAWVCQLDTEQRVAILYAHDTLTVGIDGVEVARETNVSGLSCATMTTREMLDVLGFLVRPEELSPPGGLADAVESYV